MFIWGFPERALLPIEGYTLTNSQNSFVHDSADKVRPGCYRQADKGSDVALRMASGLNTLRPIACGAGLNAAVQGLLGVIFVVFALLVSFCALGSAPQQQDNDFSQYFTYYLQGMLINFLITFKRGKCKLENIVSF